MIHSDRLQREQIVSVAKVLHIPANPEGHRGTVAAQPDLPSEATAKYYWKEARFVGTPTVIGFEPKLWAAADALRNHMDAAEYKHVVPGRVFLKYISDAFDAKHTELKSQRADGDDPEDQDEYRAVSIFWVPKEARWSHLRASALQPKIGTIVDDAMSAIERDNSSLKGILPKDYARHGLDKQRLGKTLFIDARKLGTLEDRVHRELPGEDIARIAGTYHAWRNDKGAAKYEDVPGFCKAAKIDEIRKHGHVLTPGRYVEAEAVEDNGEPFAEKMTRLAATPCQRKVEAARLDAAIAANLKELGYGE